MPDHTIFNERPESQDRAITLLQAMGYSYIPRAEAEHKRGRLSSVLFPDVMREFLSMQSFRYRDKMTPFPDSAIGAAIRDIDAPLERGLPFACKSIYDSLLYGKSCEVELYDGGRQSFDLSYIDWEHPDNNIWQVTDEFSVERPNGKFARPDIVVMVNGIPLAVIECKKSSVSVEEGIKQNVRNWKSEYIPQLFKFVQIVIAMNPQEVKYGTSYTEAEYYCKWSEEDTTWQEDTAKRYVRDGHLQEQDRTLVSLLSKKRLLDLVRFYILFDNGVKKIARYQQYFGVENTMKRIRGEDVVHDRGGVIWHTQGSGKSLTMVMLVKRIIADSMIHNPRFVLVCDRINLVSQLRDNFVRTGMQVSEATTGRGLITLLNSPSEVIITTTINKFETAAKTRTRVDADNIFLLVDESHRSNTGELHIMMSETLPRAFRIGFTGTPLLKKDKNNTYLKFGRQIGNAYRFEDGIRDGVIVPLVYDGRFIPQKVSNEKINDYLKSILAPLTEEQKEDMKKKWSRFLPIAQTDRRLSMIAFDIHEHFLTYCKPRGYKALVAASSRVVAIELEHAINQLGGIRTAALICDDSISSEGDEGDVSDSDRKRIREFFRTEIESRYGSKHEEYESFIKANLNGGEDVDIVIVRDMLLTGFDAPPLAVLYVDKPMKDHTLLQAIARVNRVYPGKDFGLIVDYWGLFANLNSALELYSDEQSGFAGFETADLAGAVSTANEQKHALQKAHEALLAIFGGNNKFEESNPRAWQAFFCSDDSEKDNALRKDFYDKLAAFSKMMELTMGSYSLYQSVGFEPMQKYKSDLKFFQKLRASLMMVYAEKVDFRKYEDGIRSLLNTFITSDPVELVGEPVALHDKVGMDQQMMKIDGEKAKATYIQTRIVSELEARRYEDPLMYRLFSQRIQDTLEEYRRSRNDTTYLSRLQKMADDLREGFVGQTYPTIIGQNSDAKAFYGVLIEVFKSKIPQSHGYDFDEDLGELSLEINNSIQSIARVDWRSSTSIHKQMRQAIEDSIWDFCEKQGVELHMDQLDLAIENLMKTALSRF